MSLLGCSADAVHSVQTFFPGPDPTTWDSCDKFGSGTDEILVCAGIGIAPGGTVPSYNIRFSIPNAAHVRIVVFDSHAARVKVLFDAEEPATLAGQLRSPPIVWDFTDAEGNRVPAGDYRLYFESGNFLSTSDVNVP